MGTVGREDFVSTVLVMCAKRLPRALPRHFAETSAQLIDCWESPVIPVAYFAFCGNITKHDNDIILYVYIHILYDIIPYIPSAASEIDNLIEVILDQFL